MLNNLHHALRQLAKRAGFTAVVVLTVALGMGANTAIFSAVNGVLLRPLPYEHTDRIVTLSEQLTEHGPAVHVPVPNFHDWNEQARSFKAMALHS